MAVLSHRRSTSSAGPWRTYCNRAEILRRRTFRELMQAQADRPQPHQALHRQSHRQPQQEVPTETNGGVEQQALMQVQWDRIEGNRAETLRHRRFRDFRQTSLTPSFYIRQIFDRPH